MAYSIHPGELLSMARVEQWGIADVMTEHDFIDTNEILQQIEDGPSEMRGAQYFAFRMATHLALSSVVARLTANPTTSKQTTLFSNVVGEMKTGTAASLPPMQSQMEISQEPERAQFHPAMFPTDEDDGLPDEQINAIACGHLQRLESITLGMEILSPAETLNYMMAVNRFLSDNIDNLPEDTVDLIAMKMCWFNWQPLLKNPDTKERAKAIWLEYVDFELTSSPIKAVKNGSLRFTLPIKDPELLEHLDRRRLADFLTSLTFITKMAGEQNGIFRMPPNTHLSHFEQQSLAFIPKAFERLMGQTLRLAVLRPSSRLTATIADYQSRRKTYQQLLIKIAEIYTTN